MRKKSMGSLSERPHDHFLQKLPFFVTLIVFTFLITTGYCQNVPVKGTVSDGRAPLPDVTIKVQNLNIGTKTDESGNFSLTAPKNSVLLISSVGFVSQQVSLAGQSVVNVTLISTNQQLSDIVVTGYSSQSKRSITGSVVNVKGDLIRELPVSNVNQALQGRVAGLTAITDGSPQGNVSIRIRGVGTLNGSDPLYIIDGVPTTGNLNQINPTDIESVSVLKDASAASIYGARAANGVVIIETKKGRSGEKASLTLSAYVGVSSFPGKSKPELLNTQQYANSLWQSQTASGIPSPSHPQFGIKATPVIPDYILPVGAFEGDPNTAPEKYDLLNNAITRANKTGTKWFDELTDPGLMQSYNVAITGGGTGSRYAFSIGYLNREGAIIHTGFERYSTRINTEFSILNNRIKIGENINFSYSNDKGINPAGNIYQTFYTPPIMPVYDIRGNFAGTHGGALALGTNYPNGVADQTRHKDDVDRRINVLGNIYLDADIIKHLTFRSSVGAVLESSHSTAWYQFSPEVQSNGQQNDLTEATSWANNLTFTNTLKYNRDLGTSHRVSLLAGTEAITIRRSAYGTTRRNLYSEALSFRYLYASSGQQTNFASLPEYSNLYSMFGKVDYSFQDKYYINGTIRRDGSSRFATGNKYEVFPAVGAAWVVSEESFLKENPAISSLKLRAGWGLTGNQGSAGDFSFATQYGSDPTTTGYDLGATQNSIFEGFTRIVRGNNELRWESSSTLNIGADISLARDKLNLTVEWYKKDTKYMLAAGTLPGAAGLVAPPLVNIGKVSNKGLDVSLGYRNNYGNWSLDVIGTFFTYKNKIIDIDGNPNTFLIGGAGEQQGFATRNQAGHEISSFFGFYEDGVIQDGSNAGNFNFRDLNKDGVITDDDRTFIGSPHPDFQYSLNVNVGYKQFDLTVFLNGSKGNEIFNFNKYYQDFDNRGNWNRGVSILNAWTPQNKSNTLAAYNSATAGDNSRPSTYFVEDGSFLRFQNVQLGYSLGKLASFKNIRIYIQAQNLFTITNYSGIDPEIGRPSDNLGFGVDNGDHYPINRTFLAGVNIGF